MEAQNMLPLEKIEVAIGDRLDRATLMDGHYTFERGCFRKYLLRDRIQYYRKWKKKNVKRKKGAPRGPIDLGHKRAIRDYMHIIDTAYDVRVSGIDFVTSQNEGSVSNQCYIGQGGSGYSGVEVHCKVIFLGLLKDPYYGTEKINHVAINVTARRWPQHRILAAKAALVVP